MAIKLQEKKQVSKFTSVDNYSIFYDVSDNVLVLEFIQVRLLAGCAVSRETSPLGKQHSG